MTKFYSRILGDRDYSLFEVLHFGLRLPGVVSSFGDVKRASVSNWASLKKSQSVQRLGQTARVTNKSALETFNQRGDLQRPEKVPAEAVQILSFHAFWRRFDVVFADASC